MYIPEYILLTMRCRDGVRSVVQTRRAGVPQARRDSVRTDGER
jgi:hypothetical protein